MKKIYIHRIAVILAMSVAVTSCGDPDYPTPVPATTAPTTSANIRFINASPDAPSLSFSVNNVASAANVSYLDMSEYFKTPVGQASVRGVATSGKIGGTLDAAPILYRGTATSQNNFTFNNKASYTFIVTDSIARPKPSTLNGTNPGGPQFLALSDNLSAPAAGKAKIRIINAAAGVSTLYATSGGEDFGTFNVNADKRPGIAYRAATGFQAVDAGEYTLELRKTDTVDDPLFMSEELELVEGKIYTIVISGKKAPYDYTIYQYN